MKLQCCLSDGKLVIEASQSYKTFLLAEYIMSSLGYLHLPIKCETGDVALVTTLLSICSRISDLTISWLCNNIITLSMKAL